MKTARRFGMAVFFAAMAAIMAIVALDGQHHGVPVWLILVDLGAAAVLQAVSFVYFFFAIREVDR